MGFLFPRPCVRPTPIGCPDCNNGTIDDPFRRRSRSGYSDNDNFDSYDSDETDGWDTSDNGAQGAAFAGGESGGAGASMDFTEADGESLSSPDNGFEDDLSAS